MAAWLEYREPGCFGLVWEPWAAPPAADTVTTEQGLRIELDAADWELLQRGPQTRATLDEVQLALQAARLATHGGFDQPICLPLVREMELLEHQLRTARTVLQRFRGRGLLCDEVGLGKTVEAGLILSELLMRGLVRSVLVRVPPSLIEQWQGELRRKFSCELVSHDAAEFRELDLACSRLLPEPASSASVPLAAAMIGECMSMLKRARRHPAHVSPERPRPPFDMHDNTPPPNGVTNERRRKCS